jgi:hypothetical protein
LRCRFGSEDPQRRPGYEMALMVERIVDGGVHADRPFPWQSCTGGTSRELDHKN